MIEQINFHNRSLKKWVETTALTTVMLVGALSNPVSAIAADEEVSGSFDEIVVTARKKSESMYDVPISINVVPEDLIEDLGAADFTDLLRNVPSLTAYQNGPGRTRRGATDCCRLQHRRTFSDLPKRRTGHTCSERHQVVSLRCTAGCAKAARSGSLRSCGPRR